MKNFIAHADCGRFVRVGEEGPVGSLVDEILLQADEVGGEEDVEAELGEEGVEFLRRGFVEGGKCALGHLHVSIEE